MKATILILLAMLILTGVFVGLICLQVSISKNNKRGKFAIPIVMFLLPFIMVILAMCSVYSVRYHTVSSSTEVETNITYDEEGEIVEIEEISEGVDAPAVLDTTIFIFVYGAILLGWPTAIITLIIELVYRSKRKHITDEEVIDIQNL